MDLKKFGQRLKKRRRETAKQSQDEFALAIKKHKKTIQNWEQGLHAPELNDLIDICNRLNCSVDYLLGNIDETSHDMHFIAKETGLTEQAIRNIQAMWLKRRTSEELLSFESIGMIDPVNPTEHTASLDYEASLNCIEDFQKFLKKYGDLSEKFCNNPDIYSEELFKEKQKKCNALSALNTLLSSSIGEAILENIYAYLHFEYEPTEEDLKITKEYNIRNGTNYECFIKGKNGYNVDAEYLNNAFLLSLQKNCMDLKKELTGETER